MVGGDQQQPTIVELATQPAIEWLGKSLHSLESTPCAPFLELPSMLL
jgi:hypothetical protein